MRRVADRRAGLLRHHGVHLRPGTWLILSDFEPGTILVTYASERYSETRFFAEYVELEPTPPPI
jgi:hypothetical protein